MLLEETESTLWEQHVSHRNNKISSFVTTVIVPKRARDDGWQKNKFLRTEKFLFSCTSLYLWIKISSCLIKNRKTKLFSFFSQTAIMLKDLVLLIFVFTRHTALSLFSSPFLGISFVQGWAISCRSWIKKDNYWQIYKFSPNNLFISITYLFECPWNIV